MARQTMVFNYGCPRSGTTFVQQLLAQGTGYLHFKIVEYIIMHPCNTDTGLVSLHRLFDAYNVVFIRSKRNPIRIFKSFYAARQIIAEHDEDFKWRGSLIGIANIGDAQIYKAIERESQNTEAQRYADVGKRKMNILELDYDQLPDVEYRKTIVTAIAERLPDSVQNNKLLYAWMEDAYMKKPARAGAMSFGVDAKLPEEVVAELRKRFPDETKNVQP